MSDGTTIEWTDATWNFINGCSVTSPGCTNCYAMRLAGTRLRNHPSRAGLTSDSKAGPVWTGEVRFNDAVLDQPLRWRRPRRIFVCAHGDLFHENVPDEWIDRVFAVMALGRQHQFQVLTKRPARMRIYFEGDWMVRIGSLVGEMKPSALWNGNVFQARHDLSACGFLPNVWLGVSVEDQERADERIPLLLDTPAAVRWLSMEPLLGPVDLRSVGEGIENWCSSIDDRRGPNLDWVVVGGESGPGARPMHPDWVRSIRDQCAAAGVPFLFKQWGSWLPIAGWPTDELPSRERAVVRRGPWDESGRFEKAGNRRAGRLLDGVVHDGFPA